MIINIPSKEAIVHSIKAMQGIMNINNRMLGRITGISAPTVYRVRNGKASYDQIIKVHAILVERMKDVKD